VVVLWFDLLLLSFVSKHIMWWYYGLIFLFVLSVSKHYVVVFWLELSLLSSVTEHNMLSYNGWVCSCRPWVCTIYGRIMVWFVIVVSQ